MNRVKICTELCNKDKVRKGQNSIKLYFRNRKKAWYNLSREVRDTHTVDKDSHLYSVSYRDNSTNPLFAGLLRFQNQTLT